MIYIRYVLARPVVPKKPLVLKNGTISSSRQQDTTAKLYLQALEELGQEVNEETLEHLQQRDKHAWSFSMDFPVSTGEAESVAREMGWSAREMRRISTVPGRNPWACNSPNCDWLDLCHANPKGDIENWWGVETSDYSGLNDYEISYRPGRKKQLSRERPGVVVTPSELRTFLRCQRKWWFEYVHKARKSSRSRKEYGARMKGTMAHKAAEFMGELVKPQLDGVNPATVSEAALHDGILTRYTNWCIAYADQYNLSPEEMLEFFGDANGAFMAAQRMFCRAVSDMDEILHIEKRFACLIPGTKTWVTCQPDIVCRSGEDIYIVDYKTSSKQRLNRVAEDFRYNPALYIYALALTNGYEAKEVLDV